MDDKQEEVKVEDKPTEEKPIEVEQKPEEPDSGFVGWGDPTFNPTFLKIAEYFGITHKDINNASSKINTIIDWASAETKSKDSSDILLKIAETSKGLDAPGMQERRYAILYRYIKLANLRRPIVEQMERLQKQRDKIEKEMKAYALTPRDTTT